MKIKKFVIRCRGIIMHEGKMLVVRHSHDASFVALPGGHLEWGEDVIACLSRELVEELSVKPVIGKLLYVNTFTQNNNVQPVEFFFEVLNGKDYLDTENNTRTHAHEISEILWLSPKDEVNILPKMLESDFRNGNIISSEVRYIKD